MQAAGRAYNPLYHRVESSDIGDAEVAAALGAPVWARFEMGEATENGFDMQRPFAPAPVVMFGQFAQSPLSGYHKGGRAKKQDVKRFTLEGAHIETTHYDAAGPRLTLRADTRNGCGAAFVKNLAVNSKGSLQLGGVYQRDVHGVRLDGYRMLNANGTLALGGNAIVSRVRNTPEQAPILGAFSTTQTLTPAVYRVGPNATTGIGVKFEAGQQPQLYTDITMLDGWSANNALRITASSNAQRGQFGMSVSSERSHFARPRYEFAYGVELEKGAAPAYTYSGDWQKAFTPHFGIAAGFEGQAAAQQKQMELNITTISASHNGHFTYGPMLGAKLSTGQRPSVMVGAQGNLWQPKRDWQLGMQLDGSYQAGSAPQYNIGVTLQRSRF